MTWTQIITVLRYAGLLRESPNGGLMCLLCNRVIGHYCNEAYHHFRRAHNEIVAFIERRLRELKREGVIVCLAYDKLAEEVKTKFNIQVRQAQKTEYDEPAMKFLQAMKILEIDDESFAQRLFLEYLSFLYGRGKIRQLDPAKAVEVFTRILRQ